MNKLEIVKIISEFNDNYNIKYVVETVTGYTIKNNSLKCPLHGGNNPHGASISIGKNIFTCWTHDCGRSLKPWDFIQKYYNLNGFKEVAEKCNELFNANIPIYNKNAKNEPKKAVKSVFSHILKVNKYLSECNNEINKILEDKRHILLNSNTGLGKTFGVNEALKNCNTDYVIFLVPTRSLAEQVEKDYKYFLLYGDMNEDTPGLKENKYIVATYNKVPTLQRFIDRENEFRALAGEMPISYTVVADEVHELMSKRVLFGTFLSKSIESLILDSDSSVLMSANTNYIYKAYKDKLFNSYISVEKAAKSYNLDNLYIYRIQNKKGQVAAQLVNKVINNLVTHDKILIQEDNKKHLEEYRDLLEQNGINAIIVNSDSKKSDEAAAEEYKSIIENSTLKNIVILCTSVINAGVNIKNSNVCVMMIQDKMQFDTQKIEQFMGRLRSDKGGNTGIVFLIQGEKPKFKHTLDSKIKYYTNLAELKVNARNTHYFNEFGLDLSFNKLKIEWSTDKTNEAYKDIADCIYLDSNCLFKVDHVQIYEKSRLKFEKANYHDDDFVIEMLSGVKTKNIEVITLALIAPVEEAATPKENISVKDGFNKILEDEEGKEELFLYVSGLIKPKDFKNKNCINLYEQFNDDRNYREFRENLKDIVKELKTIENADPKSVFTNILTIYATIDKPKDRRGMVADVKRIYVYNKRLGLNKDTKATGDYMYWIVRKNCDCFIGSGNTIAENKSLYPSMVNSYIEIYECKYENNILLDKHNKKVNIKKIKQEFTNLIKKIYDYTEKMYLKNLR